MNVVEMACASDSVVPTSSNEGCYSWRSYADVACHIHPFAILVLRPFFHKWHSAQTPSGWPLQGSNLRALGLLFKSTASAFHFVIQQKNLWRQTRRRVFFASHKPIHLNFWIFVYWNQYLSTDSDVTTNEKIVPSCKNYSTVAKATHAPFREIVR